MQKVLTKNAVFSYGDKFLRMSRSAHDNSVLVRFVEDEGRRSEGTDRSPIEII